MGSAVVETTEPLAATIGKALEFAPRDKRTPCINCDVAQIVGGIARAKLAALDAGASLARTLYR